MNKYIEVFQEEEGLKAFFSAKEGAVEMGPYDNPEVFEAFGLADAVKVKLHQIHTTNIAEVRADDVHGKDEMVFPDHDGSMTDVPGVLLTSIHGDCLPVYFYEPERRVIAMVHSGWKGCALGIVPKAAKQMVESFGASLEKIKVHIGPGISKCCFQVGPEVVDEFKERWGYAYEVPDECEGKFRIDLKAVLLRQLTDIGLPEENIEISEHCTYCEPELFSSYRREGSGYMRMGAGICMTE